jgi:hypothetical protein
MAKAGKRGPDAKGNTRNVVLDVRVVQIDTRSSCLSTGGEHGGGRAKFTPAFGLLRQSSFEDDAHSPSSAAHSTQLGTSLQPPSNRSHHPQFYPPRANSAQIGALPQNAFTAFGQSDIDGEWSVHPLISCCTVFHVYVEMTGVCYMPGVRCMPRVPCMPGVR